MRVNSPASGSFLGGLVVLNDVIDDSQVSRMCKLRSNVVILVTTKQENLSHATNVDAEAIRKVDLRCGSTLDVELGFRAEDGTRD